MIDEVLEDADDRMRKSVESLHIAFSKIRSGRPNPALLDHVELEYFGSSTPLKHVSSISVEEGRSLVIKPFEKNTLGDIEKAIFASDLGLTPANNGEVIRLQLPPLTEENRRDLTKHARHEAEIARVAIRNIRRDAIHDIREIVKEKLASEDEGHSGEEKAQTLTDGRVKEIDKVLEAKEEELLTI